MSNKESLMPTMDRLVVENGIASVIVAVSEACGIQAVREQRTSNNTDEIQSWKDLSKSLLETLRKFPMEKWSEVIDQELTKHDCRKKD